MGENKIEIKNGKIEVPDEVVVPYIEGDGTGKEIMDVARPVIDSAVRKAYNGEKKIIWKEILAGEKAVEQTGNIMPEETLKAIKKYKIALKGPLTTPVGSGYRSLNVFLRQYFDLYACIRPVKYIKGVPSPMKFPEKLNIVIFRENTEDVYAGIEWEKGSPEAKALIDFLKEKFNIKIREDSGIGLKPISEFASKRLVRFAIKYAIENKRKSVTLVHKGNIMKYTEGAFRNWGYEVAEQEFKEYVVKEGEEINGKIVIKDRIADNMFQQLITRPDEYDVIALPNLNGDYLSDAAAAQIGGLGMAPGANIGDEIGIFEATHGSAPKYKGLNKVNPSSLILSGKLMLEYLGWKEAAELVEKGIELTIQQKIVTYDLARYMEGVEPVSTSQYGEQIIKNIEVM